MPAFLCNAQIQGGKNFEEACLIKEVYTINNNIKNSNSLGGNNKGNLEKPRELPK